MLSDEAAFDAFRVNFVHIFPSDSLRTLMLILVLHASLSFLLWRYISWVVSLVYSMPKFLPALSMGRGSIAERVGAAHNTLASDPQILSHPKLILSTLSHFQSHQFQYKGPRAYLCY